MDEWDRILREEWYSQVEPDEIVADFAALLTRKKRGTRILDLGCGAGRHQTYMAKQRFEAHGVDISKTGLNSTKERLKKQGSDIFLVRSDMKSLPYMDSCFDAIISLHTIYHQKLHGIEQTISEIHRVLKTEGYLLVNFLSKRTYSYGKGVAVEDSTFVEQEGVERGVPHHFADMREIRHLLKGFKMINIRLSEKEVEGKLRSRWMVTARI